MYTQSLAVLNRIADMRARKQALPKPIVRKRLLHMAIQRGNVYGILSHWRKALSNEHRRREGLGNDEEHASQNDDLCPEGCG
jgi:hypothetical protein